MRATTVFHLIFLLIISSCKKSDDPTPVELLMNTDMESGSLQPNDWWNSNGGFYTMDWSTVESGSPSHSLKISIASPVSNAFAFWGQTFSGEIPRGKDVMLSVKIKCVNVIGQGVSIAVRGDDSSPITGSAEQFSTTQGNNPISGNFDWTTYQVKLSGVQENIKAITIYFIFLPDTSGEVYFDDASLNVL